MTRSAAVVAGIWIDRSDVIIQFASRIQVERQHFIIHLQPQAVAMAKRGLAYTDIDQDLKRRRCNDTDRLSDLSDELLLRALSFLPVSTLIICQRCVRAYQKQNVF